MLSAAKGLKDGAQLINFFHKYSQFELPQKEEVVYLSNCERDPFYHFNLWKV